MATSHPRDVEAVGAVIINVFVGNDKLRNCASFTRAPARGNQKGKKSRRPQGRSKVAWARLLFLCNTRLQAGCLEFGSFSSCDSVKYGGSEIQAGFFGLLVWGAWSAEGVKTLRAQCLRPQIKPQFVDQPGGARAGGFVSFLPLGAGN